jgi:hypothetical protein
LLRASSAILYKTAKHRTQARFDKRTSGNQRWHTASARSIHNVGQILIGPAGTFYTGDPGSWGTIYGIEIRPSLYTGGDPISSPYSIFYDRVADFGPVALGDYISIADSEFNITIA